MKLLHYNMYNKLKYAFATCLVLTSVFANAQVTLQSPYSKFGVGNVKGSILPQFRAMGGISTGVYRAGAFNNINMQNPATYAGFNRNTAVLDIGMSGGFTELKTGAQTENSFNAALSHVAMGFNLTPKSGISFGIMPYSDLGYDFKNTVQIGTNASNTKTVDYKYVGEGGLTKAYIGYGRQFGDHFRIGANVEYLFGNLSDSRSTEYVNEPGSLNTRIQDKNSIGGVAFSYGAQYDIRLDNKTNLNFGYSGSSSSKINSKTSKIVTYYLKDAQGNENAPIDSLLADENATTKMKLPLVHNFGFTITRTNKWMIGGDYRMGKWSELSIGNVNQGLQDTWGASFGGQFTPDITAINGYFKRVDYRLGFAYDKTYIQMNNQDIKQMSVTAGLGLPLSSLSRGTFYKMNVSAELGKRGTTNNGLLQEKFINLHLGFTLNDGSWFHRFKFD
ncbi:outer membrane protein transport protein [Pedobacter namyangjuensis]|uniref:outer membrane protein transport protein n=1 Tax=Pedobacter namyangjuensis TaxID=600626 RepID=UPI001F06E635|nr:outer membrane protein transport protein [Pedobacter namyangjuensis]